MSRPAVLIPDIHGAQPFLARMSREAFEDFIFIFEHMPGVNAAYLAREMVESDVARARMRALARSFQ